MKVKRTYRPRVVIVRTDLENRIVSAFATTDIQARLLAQLSDGEVKSYRHLCASLCYPFDKRGIWSLKNAICLLRQRMADHRIRINMVWRDGYRLSEQSADRLSAILGIAKPVERTPDTWPLAKKVVELRTSKGLSFGKIASQLGVSKAHVSRLFQRGDSHV